MLVWIYIIDGALNLYIHRMISWRDIMRACEWEIVFFSLQSRWKADGPVAAALNDSIILSTATIKVVALIIILARNPGAVRDISILLVVQAVVTPFIGSNTEAPERSHISARKKEWG